MNLNGPNSLIPSLGASGAISGVMGAYLVFCPNRRVRALLLRVIIDIPGYMAVGLWFLFQLVSGMGLLGRRPKETAWRTPPTSADSSLACCWPSRFSSAWNNRRKFAQAESDCQPTYSRSAGN